jgi:hypothetical protein
MELRDGDGGKGEKGGRNGRSDEGRKEEKVLLVGKEVEEDDETRSTEKEGFVDDERSPHYGAICGGFFPTKMTEEESRYFPQYNTSIDYIHVRNHILSLWHHNPTNYISEEEALRGIKSEHHVKVKATWAYLNQRSYINYGFLKTTPASTPTYLKQKESNSKWKILIVGAGMAGLALAHRLHQWGYSVTLIEGRDRLGGRVLTKQFGDVRIDLGASVVTGTVGNPLTPLFKQLEMSLYPLRSTCRIYDRNGEIVRPETDSKIEVLFNQFLEQTKDPQMTIIHTSLGHALAQLINNTPNLTPLEHKLLQWHRANLEYGCGTNLDHISLTHWDQDDQYEFGGHHCLVPLGYGALAERYGVGLDIRYNHKVVGVDYGEERVRVRCVGGQTFTGDICVVTVPLQV